MIFLVDLWVLSMTAVGIYSAIDDQIKKQP